MPEQKPPRWGAPDNAKLLRLFQDHQRDPRTGVDPQNKDRKYIKEVCTKHFHGREYKNFRPVFLSKAQEFIVNLEISGSRRVRAQNPQEENAEEEQEEQGNKDQQEEEKQAEQEEEKQEDQDEEEREEEQKADNVLKDFEDLNLEDDKMSKMYAPQILKDEGLVSLGHHYPVLGHKSVVGYNEFYLLQFFVPGLPEENFRPRVEKNGRSLVLEMHIPALFVDSERLTWMPGDSGVDHNSVTSFRSVTAHVASIQMDERVITHSHGQVVPLPFEVERDIVDVKLVHHRVDGQRHGVNVYMVNLKGVKKLKGRLLQGEYIEIGSPQQQIQQPQRQEPQQQPQGFFERLMTPARTTQRTSNVTPH